MVKVIHVYLIFEKRDYYFGSIAAIFDAIDSNTIGIAKNTLLHANLADNSPIVTKRAIIKQGELRRCGRSLQTRVD